jgi:hypothetical protein
LDVMILPVGFPIHIGHVDEGLQHGWRFWAIAFMKICRV